MGELSCLVGAIHTCDVVGVDDGETEQIGALVGVWVGRYMVKLVVAVVVGSGFGGSCVASLLIHMTEGCGGGLG